jgi:cytochrome bd-type quinol oxidase subunit 2
MAELKDKVKTTLDEGRILVIGAQVLLGLQFRSVMEKGFEKLPEHAKYMKLGGLGLMILAVTLLMWPGAYHQIVEEGEDTHEVNRFATAVLGVALLPFALGLGIDFFVGAENLLGTTQGVIAGVIALLVALFFWYGIELMKRGEREPEVMEKREMSKEKGEDKEGGTKAKDKIQQVLTEVRMVLPGAQALLGFQFVSLLMESFEKLPESSKYIHFASLSLVALAVILLMTPAAYHRLVERGEDTEHFHRFASRMLLASMIPLALGVTGDFFVVARKVTESEGLSIGLSALALLIFYGLWFGFTLYKRKAREKEFRPQVRVSAQQTVSK